MPKIIPSFFQLIGDGFVDDAYAADGNHLRWFFAPEFGFPRVAFCLERRFGLGSEPALVDLTLFSERLGSPAGNIARIVRPGISVSSPGGSMFISGGGINLNDRPILFDFHGGSDGSLEPYACWVLLQFQLTGPGGFVEASAHYDNRGTLETVDQQQSKTEIQLRADRIDQVFVTGEAARLVRVEWVRTEDLMEAKGGRKWAATPFLRRKQITWIAINPFLTACPSTM